MRAFSVCSFDDLLTDGPFSGSENKRGNGVTYTNKENTVDGSGGSLQSAHTAQVRPARREGVCCLQFRDLPQTVNAFLGAHPEPSTHSSLVLLEWLGIIFKKFVTLLLAWQPCVKQLARSFAKIEGRSAEGKLRRIYFLKFLVLSTDKSGTSQYDWVDTSSYFCITVASDNSRFSTTFCA
jgi:hypothetical protein